MTPEGYAALAKELDWLLRDETAAYNRDRVMGCRKRRPFRNGDYLYSKKRLREIDRRMYSLSYKTDGECGGCGPARQRDWSKCSSARPSPMSARTIKRLPLNLLGVDEADMDQGKINWLSPVAAR